MRTKEIKEFFSIIFFSLSLFSISLFFVYEIIKNYLDVNSFLFASNNKKVYIYSNKKIYNFLHKNIPNAIYLTNIKNLDNNSILFLFKPITQKILKSYKGIIITNQNILNLKKLGSLKFGKYQLQTPILSPFKIDKQIEIFDNVDFYQGNSLVDFTKNNNFYGVVFLHKNILFFSFPYYLLTKEIIDKFQNFNLKAVKYPYINLDKMVLLNEYNYYKLDKNFINLIKKYNLNATMFIKPEFEFKDKNIEIASVILDKYKFKQNIVGFSNENKRIDIKTLQKLGYKYTILDNQKILDNFVILPNKGFNDIFDDIKDLDKKIEFILRYQIFTFTFHRYILGFNTKVLEKILKNIKKYPNLKAKEIAKRLWIVKNIKITTSKTPINIKVNIKNNSLQDVYNFTFRVYSWFDIKNVTSNFLNIKAKIITKTQNYVDIKIKKLPKNIELNLFLRINK